MSSARVILIKDGSLIWPLSMLPSIHWVSSRLRLRVQRVAFYFYIYIYIKKATRLEFIHLSQKPLQCVTIHHKIAAGQFLSVTATSLKSMFLRASRSIQSHAISAHKSVQWFLRCQPPQTFVVCFYASQLLDGAF